MQNIVAEKIQVNTFKTKADKAFLELDWHATVTGNDACS